MLAKFKSRKEFVNKRERRVNRTFGMLALGMAALMIIIGIELFPVEPFQAIGLWMGAFVVVGVLAEMEWEGDPDETA